MASSAVAAAPPAAAAASGGVNRPNSCSGAHTRRAHDFRPYGCFTEHDCCVGPVHSEANGPSPFTKCRSLDRCALRRCVCAYASQVSACPVELQWLQMLFAVPYFGSA